MTWLRRYFAGASGGTALVLVAVLAQGIGTSVVGNLVPARLSVFVTFSAFVAAATLTTLWWYLQPAPTAPIPLRQAVLVNVYSAGVFLLFLAAAMRIVPSAASVIETCMAPVALAVAGWARARRWTLSTTAALICLTAATWMSVLVLAPSCTRPSGW